MKKEIKILIIFTGVAFMTRAAVHGGKPDIMPFSFSKNSILGQTSTLSCVASSGQGPFRFLWTHDGKAIEDTPRKHVRTVSDNVALMTIERITAEDSGNYTCIVSNAVGSGSYSAALAVEGETCLQHVWT
ncbi:unnamed protein product [Ixodes persulcatus]